MAKAVGSGGNPDPSSLEARTGSPTPRKLSSSQIPVTIPIIADSTAAWGIAFFPPNSLRASKLVLQLISVNTLSSDLEIVYPAKHKGTDPSRVRRIGKGPTETPTPPKRPSASREAILARAVNPRNAWFWTRRMAIAGFAESLTLEFRVQGESHGVDFVLEAMNSVQSLVPILWTSVVND
mmetsp:Transcript_19122/g.29908  ORF Transcript_19122/g.29908 Transcript_19122/m.29908 type:complete len:180 (+) Transcript_19122:932-1471(+)